NPPCSHSCHLSQGPHCPAAAQTPPFALLAWLLVWPRSIKYQQQALRCCQLARPHCRAARNSSIPHVECGL
ncbi:hypothetical protein E4U43_004955, partial [Claviceps pusilla]